MRIYTKIIFFSLIALFSVFSFIQIVNAQNEIGVYENDINVELIPNNPEPFQDVTVIISSYATDLNKANIEWKSGQSTVLSGIGKTRYTFKTFGPDTTIVIDVSITPQNYSTRINKRIAVSVSEVEIMWEAVNSYTPPFYRGKSFVGREGFVKVVAVPNTKATKSGVSYTWKSGEASNTLQGSSGFNKDSYVFQNKNINEKEIITVMASSVDGSYNASKTIQIPIIEPRTLFYKKSPTEGVLYSEALTNNSFFSEDEFTIVAEPYFFSMENPGSILYTWRINGEKIDTPSRKTELTIRPSSRGGYSTIGFEIENFSTLFQKISNNLRINL